MAESKIARIYATSVERGEKNINDVPEKLRDKVKEIIEADGYVFKVVEE